MLGTMNSQRPKEVVEVRKSGEPPSLPTVPFFQVSLLISPDTTMKKQHEERDRAPSLE